jgi:hypothetical protein
MLSVFSDTVPVVHQDFFNSETVIADEENQNPSSEFKAVSSTRQSSISNKTKRMAQEFPVPLLFNFSNETKCCLRTEQSAPDNRICDPDNPTRASPLS